jgi:hypothetical protein
MPWEERHTLQASMNSHHPPHCFETQDQRCFSRKVAPSEQEASIIKRLRFAVGVLENEGVARFLKSKHVFVWPPWARSRHSMKR